MDSALLILRLVVGLYIAAHGAQKLFGWFGGHGFGATRGFLGGMLGFRPAGLWTLSVGLAEFAGGLLTALGLLGPIGPILMASSMLTATLVVHWSKGPWNTDGGYEQTLTNFGVAVAIALAGSGAYAVDTLLNLNVPLAVSELVAVVAVLGVLASMLTRRAPAAQSQPSAA